MRIVGLKDFVLFYRVELVFEVFGIQKKTFIRKKTQDCEEVYKSVHPNQN